MRCWLFGHRWRIRVEWVPDIRAPVVSDMREWGICQRCGREQLLYEWNYSKALKVLLSGHL